jgi:polysaccharide export outer membrane protein
MREKLPTLLAACLILAAGLSCSSARRQGQGSDAEGLNETAVSPELMPGYMLNMSVVVAGEEEVNAKNERIQADGTVELPLLGSVSAEGKTRQEFEDYVRQLYNESYYVNPRVSVDFVLDDTDIYPWGYVTVLGQVSKPGRVRIPPTRDLTVTQAIQKVGGLEKFAKESSIRITREDGGGSKRLKVDFGEIAASGGKEDVVLKHGDVVYVPEVVF